MDKLIVLLLILCGLGISAANWRNGVKFALLFAVFEGAFRKWIAPDSASYIYFIKDIILVFSYFGAFIDNSKVRIRVPESLQIALICAIVIVIAQTLNPKIGSIMIGLLGLKCYLIYIPLLFFGPSVFRNEKDIMHFFAIFAATMLPLGILGILQYFAPPTSALNAYAQEAAEWGVATFGDDVKRARITGSFSYIAGLTTYLYIVFSLLLAFSAVNLSSKFKVGVNICLVLCVANMLMSGSRSNFVHVAITLSVAAWAMRSGTSRLSSALPRIIIGLLIAATAGKFLFSDAAESLAGRAAGDSLVDRLALIFEPIVNVEDYDFFGFGVGTTHPARAQLEEMFELPAADFKPAGAEVEPLQTIQEMGHLGFLAWMALKLCILAQLYRCTDSVNRPFLKMLAVAALSFHISHIYLSTIANHIAGLYYWFFASFIFLLPRIERIQRARKTGINASRSGSELKRRKRMSTLPVPEIPINMIFPSVVCEPNVD